MEFENAQEFIAKINSSAKVALIMDTDVDGLSGGRTLEFTLACRGASLIPVFPGKGGHATSDDVVKQVKELSPDSIIAVDTGSTAENPYRPTAYLVIDHHKPLGGSPPHATYCSSYGRQPTETSSLIAYLICKELTDLKDIDWVPLLGVFGDLGSADDFPYLTDLVKKHTKTHIRRAVSLLNAARRSSQADARTAFEALQWAKSPRDISSASHPLIKRLNEYKEEVDRALNEAARVAPKFAGENVLILISSPCLIHGLMASRWANRLPKYRVLAANHGYFPGQVVFSYRTRRKDNLIEYLTELLKDEKIDGIYAYGHHQATGGRVSSASFQLLLKKMGFPS